MQVIIITEIKNNIALDNTVKSIDMKYLISFDNINLSVELRKGESKTVEFKTAGGSLKHVVLTADKVITEPTNTHTGSGIVRMQFVESRNTTSEVCTIAKIK